MAIPDIQFDTWDEEDAALLRVLIEIFVEGETLVVGDGDDVEALIRRPRDHLFRRMAYAVVRIVGRVQMKVNLQGLWGSSEFENLCRFFHGLFPLLKKMTWPPLGICTLET